MPQDDAARLHELLAIKEGGPVTIPAGDYYLNGEQPLPIPSGATVFAYGARFHWPDSLGDRTHRAMFAGKNVRDFAWFGGHFIGNCYDIRRNDNTWEPNVCTRVFAISTSVGGTTDNLTFRDLSSQGVAGAIVNVEGVAKEGSESEVETFAENITVENCTLLKSGKFMWDYGLLWQILVWPEEHTNEEIAMANRYFRNDLIYGDVVMRDGETRAYFDNSAQTASHVTFFGDTLPRNIVRGKCYRLLQSTKEYIELIDPFGGGEPVRFDGSGGSHVKLVSNIYDGFGWLYAPTGHGPGKGCIDLVCCRNLRVAGCKISAHGDTMHIQRSHNIIFNGNHIIGSRMGAFFLAEQCKNSSIVGNLVDGSNGSRVMSIEKSNEDVTVIGNTFRGGGRGSWINQPKNLIMEGNIFVGNTTKGEHDPKRGRRSFETGGWQEYAEIYFTTYEQNATYGPVILRNNIIETSSTAAASIQCMPGAREVLIEGNILRGPVRTIQVPSDNADIVAINNTGAIVETVVSFKNG